MLHLTNLVRRASAASMALLLIICMLITLKPMHAEAGLVTSRSLRLSSSANGTVSTDSAGTSVPAGEGGNGARARHTVTFTMDTNNATIGSMLIIYCTSPILQSSCTTPTGLTAANITSVTVNGLDGSQTFSLDTTTTNSGLNAIGSISSNGVCNGTGASVVRENCIPMTRTIAATETGKPTASIQYGGTNTNYIQNPTLDNYSFYARLIIFSGTAYTGQVDYGGLAAATAEQIDIMAKVQEILNFSVGNTPTARVQPACTPISSGNEITIGDTNSVLSTLQAFANHTYFRINTNTVNGTKVFYSGRTLESGIADINPMPIAIAGPPAQGTQSQPGSEQFGLALDSSRTDPDNNGEDKGYVFNNMTRTAPYHEGHGTITASGTARFVFDTNSITTPVEIASSTGGIDCDTGAVRYIANVSTSTPAGIYRTTITFIALGTY